MSDRADPDEHQGSGAAPAAVLARLVSQLAPYAADIVFIGGWVHAIHLADVGVTECPIGTTDIDVTVPLRLPTAGRPSLVELAISAGFHLDPLSELDDGPAMLYHPGRGDSVIDLDLFTEARTPLQLVVIEGQPALSVQGYPGQRILLENAEWKTLGPTFHPLLEPPVALRVPTVAAYVLQKGLAAMQRSDTQRRAKDVVYLYEIVRHPTLGASARDGMPELAARYPEEYGTWRQHMELFATSSTIRRDAVEELLIAGRSTDAPDILGAKLAAHIRRFLLDTSEARG